MSEDASPTVPAQAEHIAEAIREVFTYANEREQRGAELVERVAEAIRGEMKSGFRDTRGDIETVKKDVREVRDEVKETQRMQGETNGKVADHQAAIAGILSRETERENAAAVAAKIREALADDHERRMRKLWKLWRLTRAVVNANTARNAGITVALAIACWQWLGGLL